MKKYELIKKFRTHRTDRGIVVTDAIVAILIVLLFAGLITSLISKITAEKYTIKLNSQQMSLVTEIFEYVEKSKYADVTQDNIIAFINDMDSSKISAGTSFDTLTTPNKIKVSVEKYTPENETDSLDLVKIVTISIKNEFNNKTYTTDISRIKKANIQEVKEMIEN